MKPILAITILSALALASCRGKPESEAMAGMNMGADTGAPSARQPVRLSPAQAQAMGVTYTVVQRGPLARVVRTVGQVAAAESRLADVTAKIDGFVEQVFVDATGMVVHRGQPLLTLYSPMLVAAQEELLTAKRLAASVDSSDGDAWRQAQALLQAARRRLAYWDISSEQVERLERTGEVTKTLTLVAPLDGVVLEKMVVPGQSVMAGMKLYGLADLSTVWIEGEVFEQDVAFVKVGALARVELAAYPGRAFTGRVGFVYPTVDEQSRTVRVRVRLPNPGGALKPGMYGTLYFDARLGDRILSVPAEAVVMTGERNLVFVVGSAGALEPRDVTLGARAGDRLEVLSGLRAGERIVGSANFLVDAESRLGSGKGMADMPGMDVESGRKRP
ncbi:MAG TPA: efflux RND transporter periplasmic adaptor subunit [Gemmatimonadales bacterium]|jgi:Cu(I)/Ag(I) efflux system membrane fusion protein|nr:efflux RND transporter periplasmic adaptor subunit [Gemmatimonadales bacterium]